MITSRLAPNCPPFYIVDERDEELDHFAVKQASIIAGAVSMKGIKVDIYECVQDIRCL